MAIVRSRLTVKGQVTIPAHIRTKLHLKPHDLVVFEERDGLVVVSKADSIVDQLWALAPVAGPPLQGRELEAAIEQAGYDEARERYERSLGPTTP